MSELVAGQIALYVPHLDYWFSMGGSHFFA
jgi:hypothetical protein